MATFAHDPSRVHPPLSGDVATPAQQRPVTDNPRIVDESDAPRTKNTYETTQSLVSVSIGGSGEPHRVVYVMTARNARNQGLARALLSRALWDMDHDQRQSVIFVRNTDPDCDVPRLITFFESLGYVQTTIDPNDNAPQLLREPGEYVDPRDEHKS